MRKNAPLFVAGLIFFLAALLHLYRLIDHFNIVVGTHEVPFWANIVGFIVFGLLSLWMFFSICECKRKQ